MKRFLTKVIVFLSIGGVSSCAAQVDLEKAELGKAAIVVPKGWTKSSDGNERINVTSSDGFQHVTFSIMTFDVVPSFDDFMRLCSIRLEAEKLQASDITIESDAPFEDAGSFGMFFSGTEASSGRLFSGFMTQKGVEGHVIYLESIGADTKSHLATFEAFVKGFTRR